MSVRAADPVVAPAEELGNVEDDEREHHERQAPLEPALVTAHPVEHGHDSSSPLRDVGSRSQSASGCQLWHEARTSNDTRRQGICRTIVQVGPASRPRPMWYICVAAKDLARSGPEPDRRATPSSRSACWHGGSPCGHARSRQDRHPHDDSVAPRREPRLGLSRRTAGRPRRGRRCAACGSGLAMLRERSPRPWRGASTAEILQRGPGCDVHDARARADGRQRRASSRSSWIGGAALGGARACGQAARSRSGWPTAAWRAAGARR